MKLFARRMGQGPAIIFMHGLFGSSDNWTRIGRALPKDYSVFLLDLRNHGRSPHSPEFDYAVMASDVSEFILDHGLFDVTLVGHSMGGKVAMRMAQIFPLKIARLVVIDIAPKPYHSPFFKKVLDALVSLDVDAIRDRSEADRRLAKHLDDPALRGFLLKNLKREGDRFRWKVNLSAIQAHLDRLAEQTMDAAVFEKPALFIRGGKSDYVLDEDLRHIRKIFPHAEFITIPNAGHWIHADAPEQLIAGIREFLDRTRLH